MHDDNTHDYSKLEMLFLFLNTCEKEHNLADIDFFLMMMLNRIKLSLLLSHAISRATYPYRHSLSNWLYFIRISDKSFNRYSSSIARAVPEVSQYVLKAA